MPGVKGLRGCISTLQLRQDSRPHAGGFAGYGRPAVARFGTTELASAAFTSGMPHQVIVLLLLHLCASAAVFGSMLGADL